VEQEENWLSFEELADLKRQALRLLADHLIEQAGYYRLSPDEYHRVQDWRKELDLAGAKVVEEIRGGAGDSGVILSPERYVPREGVLLKPGGKTPPAADSPEK
jgi:hypothetical protein